MSRNVVAVVVAIVVAAVLFSVLLYTQQMAGMLRTDAAVFTRLYALIWQAADTRRSEEEQRLRAEAQATMVAEVARLGIPVVLTDTMGVPLSWNNIPFTADRDKPEEMARLRDYVVELDRTTPPLDLPGAGLQIHFGEPAMLRRLKWIPLFQAATLLVVVVGGAWMIFTSFRSERERIWSAMARESAHQMGTPLSSLVGWLEQLETHPGSGDRSPGEPDLVEEMGADVERLLKVSLRFELIGRAPVREPVSVAHVVENLRRYFSTRLPTLGSAVRFSIEVPSSAPLVLGNETLLEWAFENLIKNSIDALAGKDGVIGVEYVGLAGDRAVFRTFDTGPGVPAQVRKTIFEIGVSTKERGWGVGLSLARRIVEDMHDGSIQLEHTETGASFRLELPIAHPVVEPAAV